MWKIVAVIVVARGGIREFPLKVVVLVLTSLVNMEGDKGCLHCEQLESIIVAERGRCGLWWWEDVV